MARARVSILLATRDRLSFLRESLASAQAQTLDGVEILVSDDGSTDGTDKYVSAVCHADPKVRLLTGNPSPGVFGNYTFLLAHAQGEAVAFLGDDDVLEPVFAEKLWHALQVSGAGVAYSAFRVIGASGDELRQQTDLIGRHYGYDDTAPGTQSDPVLVALKGQLWLGACLYRSELMRELSFDQNFGSAADWDLALRISARTGIVYVAERLWRYRDHSQTHSRQSALVAREDALNVLTSRTFANPRMEALRVALLRARLMELAWLRLQDDSAGARALLREYVGVGGSAIAPRYVGAALIANLPSRMRTRALSLTREVRGRLRADNHES